MKVRILVLVLAFFVGMFTNAVLTTTDQTHPDEWKLIALRAIGERDELLAQQMPTVP